jgi:hypothetical protein
MDFPNSPTIGQTYGGYEWDGEKWRAMGTGTSTGGGANVTTSSNPPTGKVDGDLWWEDDTGILYVFYDDGNSKQWVAIASGGINSAVRYDVAQTLTPAQQTQARTNIGAAAGVVLDQLVARIESLEAK